MNKREYEMTKEYRDEMRKPRRKRRWKDHSEAKKRRFDQFLRVGFDDWHEFD